MDDNNKYVTYACNGFLIGNVVTAQVKLGLKLSIDWDVLYWYPGAIISLSLEAIRISILLKLKESNSYNLILLLYYLH